DMPMLRVTALRGCSMGLNHRFLASFALLIALSLNSLLSMGFHVDDLDYYTPLGQRHHALSLLPNASMLQAADTCGPGHFHYDETYGYWVQDFQIILRSDSARADLQRLVRQPKVVGQLYGLAGLWLLDSAAYGEARAQLEF